MLIGRVASLALQIKDLSTVEIGEWVDLGSIAARRSAFARV